MIIWGTEQDTVLLSCLLFSVTTPLSGPKLLQVTEPTPLTSGGATVTQESQTLGLPQQVFLFNSS